MLTASPSKSTPPAIPLALTSAPLCSTHQEPNTMQRHASLISFVLLAMIYTVSASSGTAEATDGPAPRRSLRLVKPHVSIGQVAAAPAVHGKSISVGPLTVQQGAPATIPAPAPTPTPAPAPQPAQAQEQKQAPAPVPQGQQPQAPASAPTSAPVALPRGAPVAGTNDINQALACQSAFQARGGRPGIESALGGVCRNGDAAFNTLGCCQATASLLNSGNLKGCACNNLVYQQLCTEVKVGDLNCDTLRPTLVGCGLQC